MKKIIALLLAIAMLATLCVGCSKDNKNDPTNNNSNVQTTPSDNPDPADPVVSEKYEDVTVKYNVLATPNISGLNIEEIEDKFDEAMENNDFDTLNDIVSKMDQTIVMIPQKNNYKYENEYDGCTISKDDVEIEVHIMPYEDMSAVEDAATKVEDLDYNTHAGTLYETPYDENITLYVYIGLTKQNTIIGVVGSDKAEIKNVLDELMVIETELSKTTDPNAFFDALKEKEVATIVSDCQSILHYVDNGKYEIEKDDDGIYLTKDDCDISIELDDTDYVASEISDCMNFEEVEGMKYIETKNVFGFAFYADEEAAFYGFDKNTYAAIAVEGYDCSIDDIYEVVKNIDVLKCAFTEEITGALDDSVTQKDESMIAELGNALMLSLADQDIYDEVLPYVCEGNVSSYVDTFPNTPDDAKIFYDCNHDVKHYYYNYHARQGEGMYSVAGLMHGFTITFYPVEENGKYYYKISEGIINEYVRPTATVQGREDIDVTYTYGMTTPDYENHGKLSTMELKGNHYMYNRIRATLGDSLEISSKHYKSVPMTIFVEMGGETIRVDAQFGGYIVNE